MNKLLQDIINIFIQKQTYYNLESLESFVAKSISFLCIIQKVLPEGGGHVEGASSFLEKITQYMQNLISYNSQM